MGSSTIGMKGDIKNGKKNQILHNVHGSTIAVVDSVYLRKDGMCLNNARAVLPFLY